MTAKSQKSPVQVNFRRTYTAKFEPGQVVNIPLPKDTVLVGCHIRLKGAVKSTWSGGTPASRVEGAMDTLLGAIEVNTDTLGPIKYVRPQFLHLQQLAAMGEGSRKLYNVGASTTEFPTTEGPFQFGTTGQITSFNESVYLPFEQVFCEPGMGRELTYLNLKRVTSANIRFNCRTFEALQVAAGVTAFAVDPTSAATIEVTTVERRDIPGDVVFQVWKQIQKTETFTSQVNDRVVEINTENKLSGLMLYSVRGSDKSPTNKLVKKLILKVNGDNLQEIDFLSLQEANRNDYRIVAPFASNTSRLDGFAHLSQIARRDLSTILDTTKATGGVYSLQMFLTTNDSSVDSNLYLTNTADLYIVTEEITAGK